MIEKPCKIKDVESHKLIIITSEHEFFLLETIETTMGRSQIYSLGCMDLIDLQNHSHLSKMSKIPSEQYR